MTDIIIQNLINNPFKKQIDITLYKDYYVEETFMYNNSKICDEIKCSPLNNKKRYGSVDLYININNNQDITFGWLSVPESIQGQGVGKALMLHLIKTVQEFKTINFIKNSLVIKGWLSTADKKNGNWDKSVPFYERIGKNTEVECYFCIQGDPAKYKAKDFLEKADKDGYVYYLI